jgi:hypothetical protein
MRNEIKKLKKDSSIFGIIGRKLVNFGDDLMKEDN